MLDSSQTIFSTGVFLKPEKIKINGNEQWRWIAIGFEDDSFCNGNYINPIEYSELLKKYVMFKLIALAMLSLTNF